MNCDCDAPVRCIKGQSQLQYVCAAGKCRFNAIGISHIPGCTRHLPKPPSSSGEEVVIVRLEALLHPTEHTTHFSAVVLGNASEDLLCVMESAQFGPMWYVAKSAYIYPMTSYDPLLKALQPFSPHRILVEGIPEFFFKFLRGVASVVEAHERNVEGDASQNADPEDTVYSKLRPFQKRGVDFIIAHGGRGMIADDMGLGKTVQAIAVAHHYRDEWPLLVVCPVSLLDNWEKEIMRFCSIPSSRIRVMRSKNDTFTEVHSVAIFPYSQLSSFKAPSCKVVILDESHYIKSFEALRTKEALALCSSARRVVLLSGTPAMSRPIELYPQMQAIVQPSLMPSRNQFSARYCNAHSTFISKLVTKGHSNLSELHILLLQCMIRRTKLELGGELPSKSRERLFINVTAKEKKALAQDVAALRISFSADGTLIQSRAPNALMLKTATARAKIPAVKDYLIDTVEKVASAGEKIIVFAHHQPMIEAIGETMEKIKGSRELDYITITGETPSVEREKLTTHFRENPFCHVAVLSMHSCGVGHNLTCASTVVFAELDWNHTTHLQCEDRVHRMGQSSPCFIYYLFAEGTSDNVIWPMLDSKFSVTNAVLENKTGGSQSGGVAKGGNATGSGSWDAEAETRHVARADINLTPASGDKEKKQKTLEGFLTPSGSHQRPPAQPTPPTSPTPATNNNNKHNINNNNNTAEAVASPVLLDMAALRQRRNANRSSAVPTTALPPKSNSPRAFQQQQQQPTTPPPATAPRQTTLMTIANKTSRPQATTAFRVTFSPNTTTATTKTAPSMGSNVANSAASAVGRGSSAPSLTKTTFFISSGSHAALPVTHAGPQPPAVPLSSPPPPPPPPVSTPTKSAGGAIRLTCMTRSEEMRNYNARRTVFTLPTKRSRSPDKARES